ncbi:Aldo/keto reductase family protein [compost metagenome]
MSAAAVAIAWVLRKPVVTGAIVGARRPTQVDGVIAAAELRLSVAEIDEIRPYLPLGMGTNVPGAAAQTEAAIF